MPVFLSTRSDDPEQRDFRAYAPVCLRVDVTGLRLVADLPSLIDTGAYIDLDDEVLWWTEGREPRGFKNIGEVSFYDLIRPGDPICQKAIRLTKSCACLTNIGPERISVIGSPLSKG